MYFKTMDLLSEAFEWISEHIPKEDLYSLLINRFEMTDDEIESWGFDIEELKNDLGYITEYEKEQSK